MIFSYNWLRDYIKGKALQPEKIAELLTMRAFEVAEVKKTGGDFILDIDILPNRAPDCFSHLGIAREIAAITNSTFRPPVYHGLALAKKEKKFVSIEIKDKAACPRYSARVLTDVRVGSSPKWLCDRLKVCGLKSINNIVDVANYVMLETGQPIHAFDGGKLGGKKIIVRFAKKGEKITTLDNQKLDLDPNILVIADAKTPVAIAGIKGGKGPEISKKTKLVVLESANFDSKVIRRGSQKLGLRTDASLRFEHGIDPNLTELAINRAVSLIQRVAGGKAQELIDIYPKKVLPKMVKLDLNYIEKLLGVKIPTREAGKILERLGFKIKGPHVVVPTFRLDVSLPEDLIEEIGRIYGYEKISAVFPTAVLVPAKRNDEIFWEDMIKNILKEAGFTEVYNYSFIGEKEAKMFDYKDKDLIELENPTSRGQKYLRPSLLPNLSESVGKNIKYIDEIRIFELGKVFEAPNKEKRRLAGLVVGGDFYQLKGVLDLLLQKLGISSFGYKEGKKSFCHPKKCAEIIVGNSGIGFLGELSPKIPIKAVVFDLDFGELQKLVSEEHEYMPLSRFPSAVRDLAVLVPKTTKVVQVLNKINIAGGSLVRDVDLFDIYEGGELPGGKKNLAFHIIYQAQDRTLKSKEVAALHQKIIKTLELDPEWQVRK